MSDDAVSDYEGGQWGVHMYRRIEEVYELFSEETDFLDIHHVVVNGDAQMVCMFLHRVVDHRICHHTTVSLRKTLR